MKSLQKSGHAHLWLVFHLHITSSEELGIDTLRKASVDVLPRGPDGESEREGAGNAVHRVPNDVPEVRVKEEESEVHDIHDGESKGGLVLAKVISEPLIVTILDGHADHDSNGIAKGECQEEIRFHEFAAENKDPMHDRCDTSSTLKLWVGCGERLAGQVLPCLARDTISEHTARWDDGEYKGEHDGYEELHDAND